MSDNNYVFTSESVSEGHPDKICDQLSDAVLDAHLAGDKNSRVACETLVKNCNIALAGEITSNAEVNYDKLVRQVVAEIGYTEAELGFDDKNCEILYLLSKQSQDISQGVNEGEGLHKEQGAGDQGLMFGFACNETPELMPLPIYLSHRLLEDLSKYRRNNNSFLKPDAKSQVTVRYVNDKPVSIDAIVISTQHSESASLKEVEELVRNVIIKNTIPANLLTKETKYYINPTGRFVIGGPVGDCGVTGRKIIVDTYGGYGRHGGGAFSGKDPSKVDRSAAYAARYVAKNIVASGIADKCEVQLAYAIGVAQPVAVYVNTFNTGKIPDIKIEKVALDLFNLTPRGIIETLDLLKPIYKKTAAFGHFGRKPEADGSFSWEKTDMSEKISKAV